MNMKNHRLRESKMKRSLYIQGFHKSYNILDLPLGVLPSQFSYSEDLHMTTKSLMHESDSETIWIYGT